MKEKIKIQCPKCNWEPDGKPYWKCNCGKVWDTFSTGGVCPRCHYQWKETQCPACYKWSLHIDWYRGLDDMIGTLVNQAKDKIKST
jgi:hypothetical protein